MEYNIYYDTPEHLPEHDRNLIDKAHKSKWEDIVPSEAETEEGREILRAIYSHKYHMDEAWVEKQLGNL